MFQHSGRRKEHGDAIRRTEPERPQRAMKAMLSMTKIDLAAVRAAADGN